jgi:hypothetical protein
MTKVAVLIIGKVPTRQHWQKSLDSIRQYVIDPHQAVVFASLDGDDVSEFEEVAERLGVAESLQDPARFSVSRMVLPTPDLPMWQKEPYFEPYPGDEIPHDDDYPHPGHDSANMFYHEAEGAKMIAAYPEAFDVIVTVRPVFIAKEAYPIRDLPVDDGTIYIPKHPKHYDRLPMDAKDARVPYQHYYMSPAALATHSKIFENLEAHCEECSLGGVHPKSPDRCHYYHVNALGLTPVYEGTFDYVMA